MQVSFKDGKIIAQGKYFEKAKYDMSGEVVGVVADGCGGLSSYRVANLAGDFIRTFLSLDVAVEGSRLSPYLPKTVEMVGRTQRMIVKTPAGDLSVTTFLSPEVNGVFIRVEGDFSFDVSVNYRGDEGESAEGVTFVKGENLLLSSSIKGEWVKENAAFYLSAKGRADLLISFACPEDAHRAAFAAFDAHYEAAFSEIRAVSIPSSARTEEEKALYLSAYFTALENHKKVGEFSAFAAGVNYIDPLRTYYRDSYFTVLPLLYSRPELVKEEILTLARGVSEEGACPSAVKSDFTLFWGDHYDSPCFFVMEIFDYVKATGDETILSREVKGRSIAATLKAIVTRLISLTDGTGLIYKEGAYNKRDWADEVNREGYVTFVNVLYYRALCAYAELFSGMDGGFAAECARRAESVKAAINEILFDEEKGYYVNYKTRDFTEDNLSVDTVFAVLYGVAEGERAERVLAAMERLLETENKGEEEGGDFGVMCVYPPYRLPKAACHKSAHLYDYHNGANWCYLTAMYAAAKMDYGMDWRTPLLSTFRYYVTRGHYTPVEYFSPCCEWGSALQGWSAAIAYAYDRAEKL